MALAGAGCSSYFSMTGMARGGGFSSGLAELARLCLTRNQIAIASRSERIFATRFLDRFSFMG